MQIKILMMFDRNNHDNILFEQKIHNLTDLSAKLIINTKDLNLNDDCVISFIEIAYLIISKT